MGIHNIELIFIIQNQSKTYCKLYNLQLFINNFLNINLFLTNSQFSNIVIAHMSQPLKLPQIVKPSTTQQPFKIPHDNQILLQVQTSKQIQSDKKIWDKKTASCRTALKRFDKYVIPQDTNFVPQYAFNSKDKKLIQSALQIIQMRKKNKNLEGKNETIVDILQQKKEMFLVTMTHQIIDKEITNLKDQAQDRDNALKQSNEILQQDIKDFDQYQEKYKAQTKEIEMKFERQVQNRVAIQQEIKKLQINANSLRAQKTRNQQSIASYLVYKQFLNQLPPKQWLLQKQQMKNAKVKQIRKILQDKWIQKNPGHKRSDKIQLQWYFDKLQQPAANQQQSLKKNKWLDDLYKKLQHVLYNEDMYFSQPHEMIEFFNNLQQTNLFCIQNAQYSQQKYQELKIQSQEKKKELQLKYESLQEHKHSLEKQFNQLKSQIQKLKKRKQQNFSLDEKDTSNIKDNIKQEFQGAKDIMHHYMPQIQYNAQSLALLSGIQICMERLWDKLLECYMDNPKAIKEIKTMLQKKKNNEKREEAARNNKIQQEKRKSRNMEKKQPTVKVPGRVDMKRSPPQEKIMIKKVEMTGKDMDDDRKYLVE